MKNHVPLILALEPDVRQATILKRMIRDRVHAELIVVDSRDGAVSAINGRVPDVILLTALLSPRDEAELLSHLRAREGAEHVQTHTIPQLASSAEDGEAAPQGGLLSKLRRKKVADPIPGCDPATFADEVSLFIARAAEMKVITSTPSAQAASVPPQNRVMRPRRSMSVTAGAGGRGLLRLVIAVRVETRRPVCSASGKGNRAPSGAGAAGGARAAQAVVARAARRAGAAGHRVTTRRRRRRRGTASSRRSETRAGRGRARARTPRTRTPRSRSRRQTRTGAARSRSRSHSHARA